MQTRRTRLALWATTLVFALAVTCLRAQETAASKQVAYAAQRAEREVREAEATNKKVEEETERQAASDPAYQKALAKFKSQRHPATGQFDMVIRLERKPCLGPCAVYTVTVLGDRSVTFVAHDAQSWTFSCCDLVKKKTLSVSDYNMLLKQIMSMQFFDLKENYSARVTDMAGVTVTIVAAGRAHSVTRYAVPCASDYRKIMTSKDESERYDFLKNVAPPPDSLCKLESMIDQLTGADKWGEETKLLKPH